jgi:hypothetical protein
MLLKCKTNKNENLGEAVNLLTCWNCKCYENCCVQFCPYNTSVCSWCPYVVIVCTRVVWRQLVWSEFRERRSRLYKGTNESCCWRSSHYWSSNVEPKQPTDNFWEGNDIICLALWLVLSLLFINVLEQPNCYSDHLSAFIKLFLSSADYFITFIKIVQLS